MRNQRITVELDPPPPHATKREVWSAIALVLFLVLLFLDSLRGL